MHLRVGARVRTRDGRHVGEVHRVLVDLDDKAVTGVVVLKGRVLPRDVLVPLDFIEHFDADEVVLTLDVLELELLPDFVFNEVLVPPPLLVEVGPYPDGTFLVPVSQRKRLGQHQVDIVRGARVHATDGELGRVDRIEFDPGTGELDAFWVDKALRIPAEWVVRANEHDVYVHASKSDVQTRLGPQSRALQKAA